MFIGTPTSDQVKFFPFIKHPILVHKADTSEKLPRAFRRARDRDLTIGIHTSPRFAIKSGEDKCAGNSFSLVKDLDLVGIIIYGANKKVAKALDGLKIQD
ncbi:DUF2000 family protein [Spirosoma aerophilum]